MSHTDNTSCGCDCGGTESYEFHSKWQCSDRCYCEGLTQFQIHTPSACGDDATSLSIATEADGSEAGELVQKDAHRRTPSRVDEHELHLAAIGGAGKAYTTRPLPAKRSRNRDLPTMADVPSDTAAESDTQM